MTDLKEITTNTCNFCGAEETHDLDGWIKAQWRCSFRFLKYACAKPECQRQLSEMIRNPKKFTADGTPIRSHK